MFDPQRSREQRAAEKQKFRGTGLRQDGFRPKPKGPKAWSHQDDLTALIGKRVEVLVLSGGNTRPLSGTLLAADQFTLKVQTSDGRKPAVIFKSALTYFMGS